MTLKSQSDFETIFPIGNIHDMNIPTMAYVDNPQYAANVKPPIAWKYLIFNSDNFMLINNICLSTLFIIIQL